MSAIFMPGPIELIIISLLTVAVLVAVVVVLMRSLRPSGNNPKLKPCPPQNGRTSITPLDTSVLTTIVAESNSAARCLEWVVNNDLEMLCRAIGPHSLDPDGRMYGLLPMGGEDFLAVYKLANELIRQDQRAEYWYLRGFALHPVNFPKGQEGYSDLNDLINAQIDSFRKALAIKPDFGPALWSLGSALADFGVTPDNAPRFRESIECFNRAVLVFGPKNSGLRRARDRALERWRRLIGRITHLSDGRIEVSLTC